MIGVGRPASIASELISPTVVAVRSSDHRKSPLEGNIRPCFDDMSVHDQETIVFPLPNSDPQSAITVVLSDLDLLSRNSADADKPARRDAMLAINRVSLAALHLLQCNCTELSPRHFLNRAPPYHPIAGREAKVS